MFNVNVLFVYISICQYSYIFCHYDPIFRRYVHVVWHNQTYALSQIWVLRVFSGPYFPAFGLNTERYVKRGRREKWEIVQIAFFLIIFVTNCQLTLSWRRSLSYRNQIIDFHSKTMDWFLYFRAVGTSVEKELNALDFIPSINDVGSVF